jgi:hypothetical protein
MVTHHRLLPAEYPAYKVNWQSIPPVSAARMFFIAQRADRLFAVMETLDDLIENMDDAGHLKAARDLITSRWEEEQNDVLHWQQQADKAMNVGDDTWARSAPALKGRR